MSKQHLIKKLLNKYGKTFSEEIGINLSNGTPSVLFQWLYSSNLFSARIGSDIAVNAAKGFIKEGLTTPKKMKNTTWEQRVEILNNAHYTRYQERTSTFLGELSEILLENYNGDLRKVREEAGNDVKKIHSKLKKFKGMGNVGVDIFFREIQNIWTELYPFADKKSLKAAGKIGLPENAQQLSNLVKQEDFPKLIAALVRADLNKDYDLNTEKQEKPKDKNFKTSAANKQELYREAKKRDISGRSKMSKKELEKALKK